MLKHIGLDLTAGELQQIIESIDSGAPKRRRVGGPDRVASSHQCQGPHNMPSQRCPSSFSQQTATVRFPSTSSKQWPPYGHRRMRSKVRPQRKAGLLF